MAEKTSGLMGSIMSVAQNKFGKSGCYVAAEYEKRTHGVEIPDLMMQRLMGTNVIPLGKIMEFAGPPGSCKSTMAFQVAKVFLDQGHYAALIETENKLSPSLLHSILGEDNMQRLILFEGCTIQENWQDKMTFLIKEYVKSYNKSQGSGKKKHPATERPMVIILDSLGGAVAGDSLKTVSAEGHASRQYPAEALLNSRFFTALPEQIRDYPITVLYTNHEQKAMAETKGQVQSKNSKGGQTPAFFASHRIFFAPTSAVQEPRKGEFVQNLYMETAKNAFNQKGTKVRVPMRWKKEIVDNDEKQETWFDWEQSLVQYLAPSVSGFAYDREAVKNFLTVKHVSDTKYEAKELGVKAGEGVPPHELGTILMDNEEIRTKLTPYLGVKKWNVYTPYEEPEEKPKGKKPQKKKPVKEEEQSGQEPN